MNYRSLILTLLLALLGTDATLASSKGREPASLQPGPGLSANLALCMRQRLAEIQYEKVFKAWFDYVEVDTQTGRLPGPIDDLLMVGQEVAIRLRDNSKAPPVDEVHSGVVVAVNRPKKGVTTYTLRMKNEKAVDGEDRVYMVSVGRDTNILDFRIRPRTKKESAGSIENLVESKYNLLSRRRSLDLKAEDRESTDRWIESVKDLLGQVERQASIAAQVQVQKLDARIQAGHTDQAYNQVRFLFSEVEKSYRAHQAAHFLRLELEEEILKLGENTPPRLMASLLATDKEYQEHAKVLGEQIRLYVAYRHHLDNLASGRNCNENCARNARSLLERLKYPLPAAGSREGLPDPSLPVAMAESASPKLDSAVRTVPPSREPLKPLNLDRVDTETPQPEVRSETPSTVAPEVSKKAAVAPKARPTVEDILSWTRKHAAIGKYQLEKEKREQWQVLVKALVYYVPQLATRISGALGRNLPDLRYKLPNDVMGLLFRAGFKYAADWHSRIQHFPLVNSILRLTADPDEQLDLLRGFSAANPGLLETFARIAESDAGEVWRKMKTLATSKNDLHFVKLMDDAEKKVETLGQVSLVHNPNIFYLVADTVAGVAALLWVGAKIFGGSQTPGDNPDLNPGTGTGTGTGNPFDPVDNNDDRDWRNDASNPFGRSNDSSDPRRRRTGGRNSDGRPFDPGPPPPSFDPEDPSRLKEEDEEAKPEELPSREPSGRAPASEGRLTPVP